MLTPQFIESCRRQFPALSRHIAGMQVAYFDGPAGTQVPYRVIEAISRYLAHTNANHGGLFATSRESDHLLEQAQRGVADFLGATDAHEVSFGQNMTSLTFALSRALARTWQAGDEIILTRLDHDANFTPWALAARDAGAIVKVVEIHPHDCTLNMEDFHRLLSPRTKLVAVGAASNATGGINPVAEITQAAHASGALVFIDAVHYAPHGLIDVTSWNCDFLACSAYKFFGPHVGMIWGRRELLERLEAYKVRPAPNTLPGKWMSGTQSHEAIAGTLAAVEYLADIGYELSSTDGLDRRSALKLAFEQITTYEARLSHKLLEGFARLPSVKVWGIQDCQRLTERVPTFSITHSKYTPSQLADMLGKRGLFVWHGNNYALNLSEALQHEPQGMVRIGAVHYNTSQEIEWLFDVLNELET